MKSPIQKSACFNGKYRIKSSQEIYALLKTAQKVKCKDVVLYFRERRSVPSSNIPKPFSNSRLGIICPKRYLKKAKDRNLFKRVAREFFRVKACFLIKKYDMLIKLNSTPENINSKIYFKYFDDLFKKADLL